MKLSDFKKYCSSYNTIPVYEKITADLFTPVSVYLKLRRENKNIFLLESVEGIGRFARYSFIGFNPNILIENNGNKLRVKSKETIKEFEANIFEYLKSENNKIRSPNIEDLPEFTGGIVGFFGYENIQLIENSLNFELEDNLNIPDSIFGIYNTVLAFDHYKHQLIIIYNAFIDGSTDPESVFYKSIEIINTIKKQLFIDAVVCRKFRFIPSSKELDQKQFFEKVNSAKQNIFDGDIFQIVLSERFEGTFEGDILNLYRALRIINPSPYMYLIEFDNDIKIIGTSPEDLLKVKDRNAAILPIAGTRRRGADTDEDEMLENELLSDPKELAEHVMLVDLARNDLSKVCELDTVKVKEDKIIHKFSHVMHIVSRVEGGLKNEAHSIDALTACFPAGTVSGAPKIRAMELIAVYEKLKRNIYAGAVGYIDFKGNLDLCIAIRTFFAVKNNLYWQAGAGIVSDSKPEFELKEIYNKSAVLLNAIRKAEVIDENIDH